MKRWFICGLLLWVVACTPRPGSGPTVQLKSPENGVQVAMGERVLVQSTAQDDQGVVKTELWVNGRLYEVERPEEPKGRSTLDVIQIWEPPAVGEYTLTVRAYDWDGRPSEPVSVVVRVVPPPPTPTAAPTPAPTATPKSSGCVPSARFVEDVTVPDDTLYSSGAKFTKTWRLRNDGTCKWEAGTQWAFIGGDLLGAQSPLKVELADPGRIADISVDMVAPSAPGSYRSVWRLQRPDGTFFGDQAYVRIVVP